MRITISSEPRLLHILRSVVRWRAQQSGFSRPDEDRLVMAIDEAASNIIRHTYGNRTDARLAVEIRAFPDRVEFILEDWGPKVCQESLHPRALDDIRPGGLGTFFIQRFMDETCYDGDCVEGNRLRMVKYISRGVSSRDESPGQERG